MRLVNASGSQCSYPPSRRQASVSFLPLPVQRSPASSAQSSDTRAGLYLQPRRGSAHGMGSSASGSAHGTEPPLLSSSPAPPPGTGRFSAWDCGARTPARESCEYALRTGRTWEEAAPGNPLPGSHRQSQRGTAEPGGGRGGHGCRQCWQSSRNCRASEASGRGSPILEVASVKPSPYQTKSTSPRRLGEPPLMLLADHCRNLSESRFSSRMPVSSRVLLPLGPPVKDHVCLFTQI